MLGIEILQDAYVAAIGAGDCRLFEAGLREAKRIFAMANKACAETQFINQMGLLQCARALDDWYCGGTLNINEEFMQFMTLPIRACM